MLKIKKYRQPYPYQRAYRSYNTTFLQPLHLKKGKNLSLKKLVFFDQNIIIGIPFVITNYFCGNKSVFAVLNSHQRTSSTISVVCLAKTVPQDGDFFAAKMLRTEKSAFLDDFSRARGSRTRRTAIERSRKRAKKSPFR